MMSERTTSDRLERIVDVARALGYASFTKLQKQAFETEGVLEGSDVFVIGATSSGKTLVPMLLYFEELVWAYQNGRSLPKMLFVVPYRALAAQKLEEITSQMRRVLDAHGVEDAFTCVQSTGEFRGNDAQIKRGDVDVAIIITEKAYNFASSSPDFLSAYDYLVLDEVGLIDDGERGTRLDFVMAWAQERKGDLGRPRTIALGTPSYDWSRYIEAYGFVEVTCLERPVPLEEHVVCYGRGTQSKKYYFDVFDTDADNPAISRGRTFFPAFKNRPAEIVDAFTAPCFDRDGVACEIKNSCRTDASLVCPEVQGSCTSPITWLDERMTPPECLVERACRHHLGHDHQILIFKNNREDIRGFVRFLWRRLGEQLIAQDPVTRSRARDGEEARRAVLRACGLDAEDVYGVLEGPDGDLTLYQALVGGVGFHSAAVPNELRTYVERQMLDSRRLSIVCCTETLAYGVNSAVDVVIIADIMKQLKDGPHPIALNEYMNSIGRAGRLRQDRPVGDNLGYAYVLLNVRTKGDRPGERPRQLACFDEIRYAAEHPRCLYSSVFDAENDRLPFFLLNMVPAGGGRIARWQLYASVERLPMPREHAGDEEYLAAFRRRVSEAISYLEARGLIKDVVERFRPDAPAQLALTEQGERIRGYIIGTTDYELLYGALSEAFIGPSQGFCEETLLFSLLRTRHIQSSLNSSFFSAPRKMTVEELQDFYSRRMGVRYTTSSWLGRLRNASYGTADSIYYVLAAVLSWADGIAPKRLYDRFGVQAPLVQSIAEQVGDLREVAACALCDVVEQEWERRRKSASSSSKGKKKGAVRTLQGFGALSSLALFDADVMIEQGEKQIRELRDAVYYGINRQVRGRVVEVLSSMPDERAHELAESYRSRLDPVVSRSLRRIGVRYRFFQSPPPSPDASVEQRNNYLNQRGQYLRDVAEMNPCVIDFFKSEFPDTFGS